MRLMRARLRSEAAPVRTVKRAPVIFAARSKSRIPSSGPRSQCALGAKSNARGVPTRRTSTLAVSSRPTGTLASGAFGTTMRKRSSWAFTSSSRASPALIRSATPFISALRSDASSFAFPRRAISSPTTRWRWRSSSTSWMRARRSASSAHGSTPSSPGKACTWARSAPRLRSMARTASRFSTTYFRSSMVAGEDSTRRGGPSARVLASRAW